VQSERVFEDILMRENIVSHYLPLRFGGDGSTVQEKGIDVWLALEAYELAIYKHFDILVLIAGDGDYVPLVRKLHTLGTQVMLICWDFSYHNEHGDMVETKTSRQLLSEVFYPVQMAKRIDAGDSEYVKDLFVESHAAVRTGEAGTEPGGGQAGNAAPEPDGNAVAKPAAEGTAETAGNVVMGPDGEYVSTIFHVNPAGYGFIKDGERNNIFFHYSKLANCDMADLRPGMRVKYTVEEDEERSKREDRQVFRATRVTLMDLPEGDAGVYSWETPGK